MTIKKSRLIKAVFLAIFLLVFLPRETWSAYEWTGRLYDSVHSSHVIGKGRVTTPTELYTINVPQEARVSEMSVGDLDGDGKNEFIIMANLIDGNNYLYIYNGETGQLKNSVLTNFTGTSNKVFNVNLSDMDNDGLLDIVLVGSNTGVEVLKGTNLNSLWREMVNTYIGYVVITDVDGDGDNELVLPDYGSPRKVHLLDAQTGTEKWAITVDGSVYNTTLVADINNDGQKEIVFTSHSGTGEKVYAVDKNGNTLWTYLMPSFGYISAAFADFDNDGTKDILVGCDEAVYLLNASTGAVKWTYTTGANSYSGHYFFNGGASFADINNDGILDIVFGFRDPDNFNNNGLFALKGTDGSVQWKKSFPSATYYQGDAWWPPIITDIDDDGKLEILFNYYSRGPAPDYLWLEAHLTAYDGSGNEKFSIDDVVPKGRFVHPIVADINSDGFLEIITDYRYKYKIVVYGGPAVVSASPAARPLTIEEQKPKTPRARYGEMMTSSTIRWYFEDLAWNESGFVLHEGVTNMTIKTGPAEVMDLKFLDETGLDPTKQYCNRHVHTYNFFGESSPSEIFPCVNGPLFVPAPSSTTMKDISKLPCDNGVASSTVEACLVAPPLIVENPTSTMRYQWRTTKSLSFGSRGEDVIFIQTKLQELGFFPEAQKITGYFGLITRQAVINFQKNHKLLQIGIVGPRTRELLSRF